MRKQIHFHDTADFPIGTAITMSETDELLACQSPHIDTVQMGALSMDLLARGYDVHIHGTDGDIDIEMDSNGIVRCANTSRELRIAHNLYKLWRAGSFTPTPR